MLNYVNNMIEFSEFIQQELVKRGWSQADLARRSGMTTGGVSMLLNQTRKPSTDTLNIIAQVFNYSREEVYRIAGLLSAVPESSAQKEELLHLFDQLPEKEKKDLLKYIRINLAMLEQAGEITPKTK